MNTLPRYQRGEQGRFDFRVPDGLGRFVFPDWDDPQLKVEFRDAEGELRFAATTTSQPPLLPADDYDAEKRPQGGPFVTVEGIALGEFALGTAEAWVWAKVEGVPVLPYPTVLSAFEVVAGAGEGPLYTTVERVREEVPGLWPEAVTEEMITRAIADAGRQIDASLSAVYETPFPDIAAEPATPPLIESLCRRLAAHQCLLWMGRLNAAGELGLKDRVSADLAALMPGPAGPPAVRLSGYTGPLAVYQGVLGRDDDGVSEDVLV